MGRRGRVQSAVRCTFPLGLRCLAGCLLHRRHERSRGPGLARRAHLLFRYFVKCAGQGHRLRGCRRRRLARRNGCSMATLHYGATGDPVYIEDRALAHLKVVIATKLRRNESFTLSWKHADDDLRGRSTIWLHPSIPLRFTFDDPEAPQLNAKWIDQLMQSANATGGIMLVDEVIDAPEPE